MKKAELRQQYLARRAALSEVDYRRRNQQLVDQLFATYSFDQFRTVHCFISSTRQREVDTWPIIRRLWAVSSVRVLAPRCGPRDNTLTHHEFTLNTALENNRWGIPEPVADSPMYSPQDIDLVLVPLLVFDRQGHRVGYGKGFYDRFLSECRPDTQKIGLSLFPLITQIDDVFAGDVALDGVAMPGEVWRANV